MKKKPTDHSLLSEQINSIQEEIAELLPQTVFEMNLDGFLTFGNHSGLSMFGYTMEDIKAGINVFNLIIPEDRPRATEKMQSNLTGIKSGGSEYTALRKDGTTFPIIIYSSTIIKNQKLTGFRGIIVDVTQQKNTENELKESEHKFRNLAEKSLVGIYLIQDNIFSYVNSTFAEIFGYTPDEIINNKSTLDLTAPESIELVRTLIQKRLENEIDSINYTLKGITKDKRLIDVEVYGSATTVKGKPAIIGSLIDITERKKAEADLNNLAKRNEIILQTAADGFHIINEKGNILQVNPAFCKLTGYNTDELLHQNIDKLYPSSNAVNPIDFISILNEKNTVFETRLKRKDQLFIDVEISANSLRLENETLFFLAVRNTTERKINEQKIRQLSRAVEQSPVSIVITDTNGIIDYVNPKFCEVTGYSFEEVVGCKPSIIKSGEQGEEFYRNLWGTIKSGMEWRGEFHNKKKDGELYWEMASISPIKNRGVITHFLAVKEDITKRKLMEKELKEAKEKAEESNLLKANFLANMSHELRTPLIGILGFAEILTDELQNLEQKEMSNTIFLSGQRLLESLNMILDLSRLETDKFEFQFEPINISRAVKEAVNVFASVAKNKKLEFSLVIKDAEITSRVDEKIFNQVVKNLLNNAVKFTSRGGITIEIFSENTPSGDFSVVKVADTGIGISTEEQKYIFEEFRQAKEGFNRPYEGTGVGLTITKKFVELMGGKLELKSEKGKGSTFMVRFPSIRHQLGKTYSIPPVSEYSELASKPVILSVENDPSSIKIIRYFLKNLCHIEHAENGKEAIKLIEKNRYRAVLMDINLGAGMSGIDAVREIKRFPHCQDIPIVAVTSYAFPSDKEKFLKNGCTHYLSKPFDRRTIVNVMTEILRN